MRTSNWKFMTMALAASMTLFTACTDNNEPGNGDGGEDNKYELTKDIESDTELEAGKTYTLSGGIHVKNGATLKIPAGVTIIAKHDDVVDYILIEQGAKIDAQGTASNPIVMTSEKKEPGAWGGIHICGYAHTNAEGGTGSSEIGGAPYGGNNDADNSGTLRYVRVEYTGFTFDEEHEANGITFYGVGNGTTVEYCQAYMGSDDGFEWFGGSVNVKYLVSTDCSDDSFDWTEGWNGKAQFLVAYQSPKDELGYDCDCLMECDNNGKSFGATPVACPTLANLTLIGNGESKQGIRLRAGTKAKIYNAIVKGKGQCLTTETTETENALMDGSSELQYITLATDISCKEGIYSSNEFTKDGNHNIINYSVMFTNGYVGTIEGGKNLSDDSFFTQAAYQGAVPASNDWTQGWTLKSGIAEETIEELKGEITTSKTLTEGKTYYLTGEYKVKNGATLKIEPGVTIIAKHDDIVDYILVEQGSKIDAQGTAENPIVMTSEKKEAGAWGGIHICGYAHTNVAGGTGSSEIGGAIYGGNNDADNSGTLRYVRIEYSGYAFDEEHEANGFTFYGVGNGTTVEYCQAYQGSDDGFEFFGGSVNIKYCVSTSCSDDSFDWTEGWNGKAQFLVAYQEAAETLGYDCDCLLECDNNGTNFAATPVAHPILANLTLIGNGGSKQGVRLRAGTQVELYNTLITGKGQPLTVETTETETALKEGVSKLEYVAISKTLSSKEGIYTNDMFAAATGNLTAQNFTWENLYEGTIDGGKDLSADSFFTKAEYKGAVKTGDNWTSGNWIKQ